MGCSHLAALCYIGAERNSYMTGILQDLWINNGSKIVLLVFDGLGGLRVEGKPGTELEAACKPNLDALAQKSECGLLDPVQPGIAAGSGPGHLALFGYDPLEFLIGRGLLSAAGVGFELRDSDVAARVNFATLSSDGIISDRRAGRISSEENERLCARLNEGVHLTGVEHFFRTEKEHRAVLVLRGEGLGGYVSDTDPQREGLAPLEAEPLTPDSQRTAVCVRELVKQSAKVLQGEPRANAILLRGFDRHRKFPSFGERYGLRGLAIACYPMYQGISRLLGMEVCPTPKSVEAEFEALRDSFPRYDFFFLHIKDTDSRGEDRNFDAKVQVIERVDGLLPQLMQLSPDVVAVTGDHSTPAAYGAHSWHPVPALVYSKFCRGGSTPKFDEYHCAQGMLGRQPSCYLMGQLLANAGRLNKYGA